MIKQRWMQYISAALLSVSLVGCSVVVPPVQAPTPIETPSDPTANPDIQTADDITEHFQVWLDQNITNYRYTIERSCFCVEEARGPVTIEVNGDQVTITDVATGAEGNEFFDDVNTITKIYELLQTAAEEGADEITATYDDVTGVPLTLKIDKSFQMADEEMFYTISNFEVLQ